MVCLINPGCNTGTSAGWENLGSQWYLLQTGTKTWVDAHQYCGSQGGVLAKLRNVEDYNQIRQKLQHPNQNKQVWIGLNDRQDERGRRKDGWRWTDGRVTGFTRWHNTEPTNSNNNEDCVKMFRNTDGANGWIDDDCSRSFQYVCSRTTCPGLCTLSEM